MDGQILRIMILVFVFAAIVLGVQVLLSVTAQRRDRVRAVNKRLKLIEEGRDREDVVAALRKNEPKQYENLPPFLRNQLNKLRRMLLASGLSITPPQILVMMAALSLVLILVIYLFAVSLGMAMTMGMLEIVLAFAICTSVVVPLLVINFIAQRRRRRMEAQFPVALDIFVRALRSGHPVASAISLLTKEMEDPIGSEFGLVSDEVAYGIDLDDALATMADRWDLEDMRMFVVSLNIQTETGGNLAEILENLADVIRARAQMFLKVRALSSEGRMTGWILTAVPIVTFVGLFLTSPQFFLAVSSDKIFQYGFPALVLLYVLGVYIIRRMVDLKV